MLTSLLMIFVYAMIGLVLLFFWPVVWRVGLQVVLAIGLLIYIMYINEEKKAQKKEREVAELRQTIATAKANASSEGKKWDLLTEPDPASGKLIARSAYIISNDNLCHLIVQKRLNGSQLAGLNCPDFNIREWDDVEVIFDSINAPYKMDIQRYSDGSGVYIPSFQNTSSGYLSYEEFINRLKDGVVVSIKIPSLDGVWTSFSLSGSSEALNKLGKVLMKTNNKNDNNTINSNS